MSIESLVSKSVNEVTLLKYVPIFCLLHEMWGGTFLEIAKAMHFMYFTEYWPFPRANPRYRCRIWLLLSLHKSTVINVSCEVEAQSSNYSQRRKIDKISSDQLSASAARHETEHVSKSDDKCGRWQHFYPRDAMPRAGLSDSNVSVCLSIRLSVCYSRYCIKTVRPSVMISQLLAGFWNNGWLAG